MGASHVGVVGPRVADRLFDSCAIETGQRESTGPTRPLRKQGWTRRHRTAIRTLASAAFVCQYFARPQ
ncbi:hypothetical protein HSR121_1965 [Halapricum desulfuricans]|uniref:Uncharacterized protein n=1 Tax=Halapricum desulfuricans TaxID=2841257 RepID=A0A897N5F8_9EURY|nr:hypothetical protein HSR121_1965 [Halapricum desulfuricans]